MSAEDEGTKAAVRLGLAVMRLRARLRLESGTTDSGFTISQLSILSRIVDAGTTTASRLAQTEHIRPQSVAESVAALREGGLVSPRPDPADGRKTLLSPTDRGRALVGSIHHSRDAWLAQAVRALDDEDRRILIPAIDVLERLVSLDVRDAGAADRPA